MVGYQLMRSNVPLIDSGSGTRSLRYYVHKKKIFMGSKIYTGLMFLSLFEPPLLSFLPWFASEFAKASFFPTLGTLRLTFLVKLLQLLVTFVAQILVIYYQYTNFSKTNNDSFVALIYLNVCLSSLTFVLKIVEGSVKREFSLGLHCRKRAKWHMPKPQQRFAAKWRRATMTSIERIEGA